MTVSCQGKEKTMHMRLLAWVWVLAVLPVSSLPVAAGQPGGKVVLDHWEVAYLEGGRAGYAHTFVEELNQDGKKLYRAREELKLKVKRFSDVISLGMQTGTTETADGKVISTFMRQQLGKTKDLQIIGTVTGKELRLVLDNSKPLKPAPWNDDALGLYRQQTILKDRQIKPSDKFSFLAFEPSVNLVIRHEVEVKEHEDVAMLDRTKRRLLRVEIRPEKLEGVALPPLFVWVDDKFAPVCRYSDVPGLGKIMLYRTTKEVALAPTT